jgi:hypothetical protein
MMEREFFSYIKRVASRSEAGCVGTQSGELRAVKDKIPSPRPEEPPQAASRRTAAGRKRGILPMAALRDARFAGSSGRGSWRENDIHPELALLRREFSTVKWMLAINLTLTLLILGKLFWR